MEMELKIPNNTNLNNRKALKRKEVLNNLLSQLIKVDFRQLAELSEDDNLKKKHYLICTIQEILRIAYLNSWGLARRHDFIYVYNGSFWEIIEDEELKNFLGECAEKLGVDKFDAKHYQFRDELFKQFLTTAYLPEPEHTKDRVLINLLNGTFEITPRERILRNFQQKDFITYQLPFNYDIEAKAPLFYKYLNEVLPDPEAQNILSEYIGYIFIKNSFLKLEKSLILHGTGANGKSVFFEIIRALLGEQNFSSYSLSSLTNEKGYHRAEIANKLVNYASEINGSLETSRFKALVSGEPIEARKPYGQAFILNDYAKLIFNTNELPRDVEHTQAFFRRFLIIPFSVQIPDEKQDKELSSKIIENELPGVFNWVLEGLERLINQKNFSVCNLSNESLTNYINTSDSVKMWLDELNIKPDIDNYKLIKDIYPEYKSFCFDDGYRALGKTNFIKRLRFHRVNVERKDIGIVAYLN